MGVGHKAQLTGGGLAAADRVVSARTEENVETVNDLVLSQRGQAVDPQDCP